MSSQSLRHRSITRSAIAQTLSLCRQWLLAAALSAAAATATGQVDDSAEVASAVSSSINLDKTGIESRLNAIESTEGLDTVQKSTLKSTYQTALDYLKTAEAYRLRAAEFGKILQTFTVEAAAIEQALQSHTQQVAPSGYTSLGNEEIDATLSYERSRLSALQSELQERSAEIDLLRNEQPQVKLAAAEAKLTEIENLTFPKNSSRNDAVFEARSTANRANKIALRARINLLDQKRISYETRLDLATAAQTLAEARRDSAQQQVQILETESLRRKNIRVDNAIERTKKLTGGIAAIPVVIRDYLDENKENTTALVDLISRTADTEAANFERDADLTRLKKAYAILTEQLRVAGFNISPGLAIALRKEREALAALVEASSDPGLDLQQRIIDGRLKQIKLDSLLTEDERTAVANLLARSPDEIDQDLNEVVVQLVTDRYRIVGDLHSATGDYVAALGHAQGAINNQRIVFEKYRDLVDELLFWVPSATTIQWDNFKLLAEKSLTAFSPDILSNAYRQLISTLKSNPLRYLLLGAAILLLFKLRKRLVRVLEDSGKHVGKVQSDRFHYTLLGLCITALLNLPLSLLLMLSSWIVAATGEYQPIADGLESAAYLYFLLGLYYQLCRPKGLGEQHFKWNERSLEVTRKNMRWLIAVLVPISIVTSSTEARYGQVASDTLGIIALVIGSVAVAVFFHFLLKPIPGNQTSSGQQALMEGAGFGNWSLYCVAVIVPSSMALLALNGYYYTAVQLEGRIFSSACIIAVAIIIFFVAMRLLAISERRLRFKQLLEERKVAKERQDEQELASQSGEALPESVDAGQLDLETVSAQTRSLTRLFVVVLCATTLWSVWSSLLPALGVFDDIVLWQTNTGVEGNYEIKSVTLDVVAMACLWIVITILATRNLSGMLDMMLLSRMDLDPGTNYAITSLLNYVIVFTGIIVVCYLLGAQWSKLQWLVAALSVGLGFGLQEIVANFFSGLLILFERPIRVGDTVTIGGNIGTVTKIRLRATTVMDWDRREQIIPNKTFITEQLTNWTLSDPITRIIVRVGVSYNSDVDEVHEILSGVVNNNDRVLKNPPPSVFFVGFGDSSLDYELRVFVSRVIDLMPLTHEINSEVFRVLKANNIEIPFPQRDLHIRSKETESERPSEGDPTNL